MNHIVNKDEDGSRVDRIVKNICGNLGYVFLQKLFRLGKVKVNHKKVKASFRVFENDEISVDVNPEDLNFSVESKSEENINPKKAERFGRMLDEMLIFENDDFLALNKNSGLAVQLGSKLNFCVENLLKSRYEKYFLVHRLDKDTSGILLVAKNPKSARELTRLFREGKIKKTYLALVDAKIPHSGLIKNFIGKSFISGEERMTCVDEKSGKSAITKYTPIKIFENFTLLELKPQTGRKHQLRVHCSEKLNAPILGDKKYNKNNCHDKLFLHAFRLEIPDLKIKIEAPLPKYFEELCGEIF